MSTIKGVLWTGPGAWPIESIAGHTSPYPSAYAQFRDRPWKDFILAWPGGQPANGSAASYYTVEPACREAYGWAFRAAQVARNTSLTIGLYTGSVIGHPFSHADPQHILDPASKADMVSFWSYVISPWRGEFGELSEVVLDAGAMPDRWTQMLAWRAYLKDRMVKTRIEAIALTPAGTPDPTMATAIAQMGILRTGPNGAISYSHPNLPTWTVPPGADWALALQLHAGPHGPEVAVTVDQLKGFIKAGWTLWPDFAHDEVVQKAMA